MKKLAALLLALQLAAAAQPIRMNRTPDDQKEVNQRIFAILDKSGAADGVRYAFDQIVSSKSEARISVIRDELHRLGYVAKTIDSHVKDGDTTYYVDAYKWMEYRREILERDSLAVLDLAETHHVFYDGWGAELGSNEEPNQSPEPTATAVTPPAAQEPRQP